MHDDTDAFNRAQAPGDQEICALLAREIDKALPEAENRVWHAHPVWFLDGNPIVGYSRQKPGVRLMFWSGADFEEEGLPVHGKRFRDASVFFTQVSEISLPDLRRWLGKAREVQWNYRDLVKRKGRLERMV